MEKVSPFFRFFFFAICVGKLLLNSVHVHPLRLATHFHISFGGMVWIHSQNCTRRTKGEKERRNTEKNVERHLFHFKFIFQIFVLFYVAICLHFILFFDVETSECNRLIWKLYPSSTKRQIQFWYHEKLSWTNCHWRNSIFPKLASRIDIKNDCSVSSHHS